MDELDTLKETVKKEAPHEELVLPIGKDLGHWNTLVLAILAFTLFPFVNFDCQVNKGFVFFP